MEKLTKVVLFVVLFGLAAEVVILGLQNRKQKEMIRQFAEHSAGLLEVGDRLPPALELAAPDGTHHRFPFSADQPPRLLLVFNTRCPACVETLPSWNRLAQTVGGAVELVAVTSDSPAEVSDYVRQHATSFSAYSFHDADYREILGISFVPHTILVDASGTVLGIWPGALSSERAGKIENLVGGLPTFPFAASPPASFANDPLSVGEDGP